MRRPTTPSQRAVPEAWSYRTLGTRPAPIRSGDAKLEVRLPLPTPRFPRPPHLPYRQGLQPTLEQWVTSGGAEICSLIGQVGPPRFSDLAASGNVVDSHFPAASRRASGKAR